MAMDLTFGGQYVDSVEDITDTPKNNAGQDTSTINTTNLPTVEDIKPQHKNADDLPFVEEVQQKDELENFVFDVGAEDIEDEDDDPSFLSSVGSDVGEFITDF